MTSPFIVEHLGKSVKVWAETIDGVLWVALPGHTFTVKSRDRREGQAAAMASGDATRLLAPMPGKIVKIFFNEGDEISKDSVVLVMEAMKMEYSLKATLSTRILRVLCKPGEQVQLNQLLCEFEPAP
jgi:biotin carboxyl carrier protein